MPKVSVIIPVYKVEAYLPACLDSVLSQTLSDIEVICVDDASPDGCPAILDAYAARDARLRAVHLSENRHQGYCRNAGMELARGEYLYFLDSDDMITPDALEAVSAAADRDGLDGVFFDSKAVFETPALKRKHAYYKARRSGLYEDRVYGGRELFEAFCDSREWTCYIQRQLWRRSFILGRGVRFPERTEHEDEWFPFAAVLQAKRVRYLPGAYFIRRYREDSVMTRPPSARDFHGYFRLFCMMTEFTESRGLRSRGTDVNIGRLYDKLVRLYPVFAREEDPEGWFSDEAERRTYRAFAAARRADAFYADLCRGLIQRLEGVRELYICGAGVIAAQVFRGLTQGGLCVRGFLVSGRQGNPPALFGHPVRVLDEVRPSPDGVAVIAVSEGYREEIGRALADRGWSYVYYDA